MKTKLTPTQRLQRRIRQRDRAIKEHLEEIFNLRQANNVTFAENATLREQNDHMRWSSEHMRQTLSELGSAQTTAKKQGRFKTRVHILVDVDTRVYRQGTPAFLEHLMREILQSLDEKDARPILADIKTLANRLLKFEHERFVERLRPYIMQALDRYPYIEPTEAYGIVHHTLKSLMAA